MSGLYRIASVAQDDLDEIWDYLGERNIAAAKTMLQKLESTFLLISQNPTIGRTRNELMTELRSFPVGKYLIFYRPLKQSNVAVEIVRVLHGARDIPSLFE